MARSRSPHRSQQPASNPPQPAAGSSTGSNPPQTTVFRWIGMYQGAQGDLETTQLFHHKEISRTLAQQLGPPIVSGQGFPKFLGQGSGHFLVVKWLGCFDRGHLGFAQRAAGAARMGRPLHSGGGLAASPLAAAEHSQRQVVSRPSLIAGLVGRIAVRRTCTADFRPQTCASGRHGGKRGEGGGG